MSDEKRIRFGEHKVRPAGRHLLTIGRELIKDQFAAVVELVKNSFDADSPIVRISLKPFVDKSGNTGIEIILSDEGHGMSYDTVLEKWMVPSTDDKLQRKFSPKGRTLQGRKGVGRYAVSVLGDDMVLETVDEKGEYTTLVMIWDNFVKAKYLDEVGILVEAYQTERKPGTIITIRGSKDYLEEWNFAQLQRLKFELKKLVPPIPKEFEISGTDIDEFRIEITFGEFPDEEFRSRIEEITPYELLDFYDYRISGEIDGNGNAELDYYNNRIPESPSFRFRHKVDLNHPSTKIKQEYCGNLKIDFRVFDRDSESIDGLISRGLKDPATGNYVGRREARNILDTYSGIGVFRNGFRIRPLGDAGYDWLELDKKRVQDPSFYIGSDQIIGFIHIESEEISHLEEKSARDGLKENRPYEGLKEISLQILRLLEEKRAIFRRDSGLGRVNKDITKKINKLFDFKEIKDSLDKELDRLRVDERSKEKIKEIIEEKEKENNRIAGELERAIAVYQGQATLGKIINVIMHEGRKPLSYFKNQIPNINNWVEDISQKFDPIVFEKIIDRLNTISEQSQVFVKLFEKVDPLSSRRRNKKHQVNLESLVNKIFEVFEGELESNHIQVSIKIEKSITFYGWPEDFYVTLTNLIDNSIYWLYKTNNKKIEIISYTSPDLIIIDYKDNGVGIPKDLIESEIIFDPGFSRKTEGGTGLGLAIAGEAVSRNSGKLKAIFSEQGAYFRIELPLTPDSND